MLYDLNDNPINEIPCKRRNDFLQWRQNLADADYDAVVEAIKLYVDAVPHDKPFVSSFIPGADWRGTPYQSLYDACGQSYDHSRWFFGLIVWQVMIDHQEEWVFKTADKDEDILGTTYWRKNK